MDANLVHELPAVHTRHHEVEQDQGRLRAGPELRQCIRPVPALDHLVGLCLEDHLDGIAYLGIVLDDENAGRSGYGDDERTRGALCKSAMRKTERCLARTPRAR